MREKLRNLEVKTYLKRPTSTKNEQQMGRIEYDVRKNKVIEGYFPELKDFNEITERVHKGSNKKK